MTIKAMLCGSGNRSRGTFRILAVAALLPAFVNAQCAFAQTAEAHPSATSFRDAGTLSAYFFGAENAWDAAYDRAQQWKKDNRVPISLGAHQWWHLDAGDHLHGNGYGLPGLRGTYFYYATFDPSLTLDRNEFLNEIGFHSQTRFRDSSDKLRSFYADTIWSYEAYGYAKTGLGRFKAGQIIQDFGMTWNNTWWEGVPFFDGYRANPSWGFSWDNNWSVSTGFSVASTLQYFITDDRVSGAFAGANAEASPPLAERNTFNVRVVPQWIFNDDTTLALGVSAFTREIDDASIPGVDSRQTAYAIDLNYTIRNLSLFGQYTCSHGATTPARYVSGGPSDMVNSIEVGASYRIGPVSARVVYSEGWDHNPSGRQSIFNPGLTFQLSKGLTAYAEYVRWNATNSSGTTSKFDDGYELILNWNY